MTASQPFRLDNLLTEVLTPDAIADILLFSFGIRLLLNPKFLTHIMSAMPRILVPTLTLSFFLLLQGCGDKNAPRPKDIQSYLETLMADAPVKITSFEAVNYPAGADAFDVKFNAEIETTQPLYTYDQDPASVRSIDARSIAESRRIYDQLPAHHKTGIDPIGITLDYPLVVQTVKPTTKAAFSGIIRAERFVKSWKYTLQRSEPANVMDAFDGLSVAEIKAEYKGYYVTGSDEHKQALAGLENAKNRYVSQVSEANDKWKQQKETALEESRALLDEIKSDAADGYCFQTTPESQLPGSVFLKFVVDPSGALRAVFHNDGSASDTISYEATPRFENSRLQFELIKPVRSSRELFGPFLKNAPSSIRLTKLTRDSLSFSIPGAILEMDRIDRYQYGRAMDSTMEGIRDVASLLASGTTLDGVVTNLERAFSDEIWLHIDEMGDNGSFSGTIESLRDPFLKADVTGVLRSNRYDNRGGLLVMRFTGMGLDRNYENEYVREIFALSYSKSFDYKDGSLISDENVWDWEFKRADEARMEEVKRARNNRRQTILDSVKAGLTYEGTIRLQIPALGLRPVYTPHPLELVILDMDPNENTIRLEISHKTDKRLKRAFKGIIDFDDYKTGFEPLTFSAADAGISKSVIEPPLQAHIWMEDAFVFSLKVQDGKLIWGDLGEFAVPPPEPILPELPAAGTDTHQP